MYITIRYNIDNEKWYIERLEDTIKLKCNESWGVNRVSREGVRQVGRQDWVYLWRLRYHFVLISNDRREWVSLTPSFNPLTCKGAS